jgi:hypothetical protein
VKQLQFQRLSEGHIYKFRVIGVVTGPDDKDYFKLKDPNGVRHLLSKELYHNYPFEENQDIQCRIDRINCSGKIYIEPLHPFYEYNRCYMFPVIRFDEVLNTSAETETHAVLLDKLGSEINIPIEDLPPGTRVGDFVKARVVRIKKGRIYVSTDDDADRFPELKHGDRQLFQIVGVKTYGDGYDFFVLKDDKNRATRLRIKFYQKYGLAIGKSLYCRMIRLPDAVFFEPDHPLFEPGMDYEFDVIGQKLVNNYPEGEAEMLVLKNPYGKDILMPKDPSAPGSIGDKVTYRVVDIQKGEPFLTAVS